ncbi:MAG: YjiH family protein [bacterium]|nr:YjiH family protein [bacterium]
MIKQQQFSPFNFLFFSAIGIFMFFIPVTFMGKNSIPIDHVITMIRKIPHLGPFYVVIVTIWGVARAVRLKKYASSFTDAFFFITNLIGTIFCAMVYFNVGPEWFLDKNIAPYIFNAVAVSVTILIPIGSIFLAFLVNYGLMECVGELMVPIMRPVFHTPGRAAIDAVASFVGSYSVGLIITNNVYRKGGYTAREAAIIGTGFSTVSATFMIIIAKTLGIIDLWNIYFWVTLAVCFAVTAITLRIPPLSHIPDTFYPGAVTEGDTTAESGNRLERAWKIGVKTGATAPGLCEIAKDNFTYGIVMASGVGAAIMFFGVSALLISKYTALFDYTAWIYYPFFKMLGTPDAMLAAKAASTSIADMFLPAILCKDSALTTRFIIAVVCISEVLFFSGMLPCLTSTDIPLKMREIFIIWFERVAFSILLASPIVYVLF